MLSQGLPQGLCTGPFLCLYHPRTPVTYDYVRLILLSLLKFHICERCLLCILILTPPRTSKALTSTTDILSPCQDLNFSFTVLFIACLPALRI